MLLKTHRIARRVSRIPRAFIEQFQIARTELILLDVMLPGEDGLSILKKLKANPASEKIPVIMVTALGSEFDKVIALDNGADGLYH